MCKEEVVNVSSVLSSAVIGKSGHDIIFNRKNKKNIAAVGKATESFSKVEKYKGLVIGPSTSASKNLRERLKLANGS